MTIVYTHVKQFLITVFILSLFPNTAFTAESCAKFFSATKSVEVEKELSKDLPHIYINLPEVWLPSILNIPNRNAIFLENFSSHPSNNNGTFSIRYRNEGYFRLKSSQEVLSEMILRYETLHQYLWLFESHIENNLTSANELIDTYILPALLSKAVNEQQRQNIKQDIEGFKRTNILKRTSKGQVEIEGVVIDGQYYPIEAWDLIVLKIKPFQDNLKRFANFEGQYLYRSVTTSEWGQIVRDGYFKMPIQTNFEGEVGPQVTLFANEPGYSGNIIRIRVDGPYFRHAGSPSAMRVETIIPLMASVEVLKNGKWLTLKEFRNNQ